MIREAFASKLQGGLETTISKVVTNQAGGRGSADTFSSESWLSSAILQAADMCMRSGRANDFQDCLADRDNDVTATVQALQAEAHAIGDTAPLQSDCERCNQAAVAPSQTTAAGLEAALAQLRGPQCSR